MGCGSSHKKLREDDQDGYACLPVDAQSLEDTEEHTLLDDQDDSLQKTGSYIWIDVTDSTETRKREEGSELAPATTQENTADSKEEETGCGQLDALQHTSTPAAGQLQGQPDPSDENAARPYSLASHSHVTTIQEERVPDEPSSHVQDQATPSLQSRRQRGTAAYETLRNHFKDLISLVHFDTVAHTLLQHKILNPEEIQTFRAAGATPTLQIEKLLFNVMGKISARPEWFDVFCDALKDGLTPEMVKELRAEYRSRCAEQPVPKTNTSNDRSRNLEGASRPNPPGTHEDLEPNESHGGGTETPSLIARPTFPNTDRLQTPSSPTSQDGNSPLHIACRDGNRDWVERLLQCNADVNCRNKRGETTLHVACLSGNAAIAGLVARYDPSSLDGLDESHNTPIHLACNNPELMHQLLACTSRADLDRLVKNKNQKGDTPIHLACERNNLATVKALLKCTSVSPHLHNIAGRTPLHVAADTGNTEIIEELVRKCPLKEFLNDHMPGETAMHVACSRGHGLVVKLLRHKKASKKVKNRNGELPADVALKAGQQAIYEFLTRRKWWQRAHSKVSRTPSCPSLASWSSMATVHSFSSYECTRLMSSNAHS